MLLVWRVSIPVASLDSLLSRTKNNIKLMYVIGLFVVFFCLNVGVEWFYVGRFTG